MKNLFLKKINKNQNIDNFKMKGFSLVELLVSITLFTFVSLIAVASLVATQQLNSSLKATRNLYDNMYFTMDEIGRELRQGNSYSQATDTEIIFTPYNDFSNSTRVKYFFDISSYSIKKCNFSSGSCSNIETMTNNKIKILSLTFTSIGWSDFNAGAGDRQQPSIKIKVKGENSEPPKTSFELENFITQRDTAE